VATRESDLEDVFVRLTGDARATGGPAA
jgi:hypothetical protein